MEYLDGKDHVNISGLKINCRYCGADVVVKYLTIGEEAECQNCEKTIMISAKAISTDEPSSILRARLTSPKFPIGQAKLTLAERIKKKYRRIEIWIGAATAAVSVLLLNSFIEAGIMRLIVSILIGFLVTITISNLRQEEEDSTPKSKLERTETGCEKQAT